MFGVLLWLVIKYAKRSKEQEIHRWLEEEARKVNEDVADIMAQPVGTDDEFLAATQPDSVSDDSG